MAGARASSTARRPAGAASTALGAADVVDVAMAQHQQVDGVVAARAQQRHEHALAGVAVARILRPGIEEQHVAARAHQHRRALADVGGDAARSCPRPATRAAATAAAARAAAASTRERAMAAADDQRAAARPAICAQGGAAGTIQHRAGTRGQHCQQRVERLHRRARRATRAAARRMPSSASGVTTSVTDGIATRLARKPTSETCWKKTSVSGVRPSVAIDLGAQIARAHARARVAPAAPARPRRRRWRRLRARGDDAISRPTAANDSQKPACVSAHGSRPVTTTAAASSTSGHGQRSASALQQGHASRASRPFAARARPSRRRRHSPSPPRGRPSAPRSPRAATAWRARCAARAAPTQQAGEPREHRDVQPADRHQVRDAGIAKEIPVVCARSRSGRRRPARPARRRRAGRRPRRRSHRARAGAGARPDSRRLRRAERGGGASRT